MTQNWALLTPPLSHAAGRGRQFSAILPTRMMLLHALLLAVAGPAAVRGASPAAVFGPGDGPEGQRLPCWRIPATVHIPTTVGGTDVLMMFAEGRWYFGDGCNRPGPKPPVEPIPSGCQAELNAFCNSKANAECVQPTVKKYGEAALPMVGLYDSALDGGTTWRCYAALGVKHGRWNGTCPGYCSEDDAVLAAVYAKCNVSGGPAPPPVYPPPPPGAKRAIFARRSTDSGATCETHLFISRIVLTFRFCSPRANEIEWHRALRRGGGATRRWQRVRGWRTDGPRSDVARSFQYASAARGRGSLRRQGAVKGNVAAHEHRQRPDLFRASLPFGGARGGCRLSTRAWGWAGA
jgi:hypothetical protein